MSIYSMTAFANAESSHSWGRLCWEIRSVNHRYLEVNYKLPETLRSLEAPVRDRLRKRLNRGKVDVFLRLIESEEQDQTLSLNHKLLEELLQAGKELDIRYGVGGELRATDVLQWPGVIVQRSTDGDTMIKAALETFDQALSSMIDSRQREGESLAALVEQRLDDIDLITEQLRKNMPSIIKAQTEKLQQKLEEFKEQLAEDRLEAEITLLAQKADVDEELDRLDTHVKEVRRILHKGGACGRRLDFLMQELNREANTLSSKAVVAESTQAAVELKVLIEQMREQIQNIE